MKLLYHKEQNQIAKNILFALYPNMQTTILPKDKPYIINILTDISKEARLPLYACRGCEDMRYGLANKFSGQLQKEIAKKSKDNQCSVTDYIQAINKVFGEHKINFTVDNNVDASRAGAVQREIEVLDSRHTYGPLLINNLYSNISGYKLHLPLNNEETVLTDTVTGIHEARHLFDYVTNPKTINFRTTKMVLKEDKSYEKAESIIDDFMNNYDKYADFIEFKKETRRHFNQLSNEDAIDTLQSIRHSITTEQNAYSDEVAYLLRNPIKNAIQIFNTIYFTHSKLKLNQKLKFANKLLKEKLSDERAAIKENLPTNKG